MNQKAVADWVFKFLDHIYSDYRCEQFEVFAVPSTNHFGDFDDFNTYAQSLDSDPRNLIRQGRGLTGPERREDHRHIPHGLSAMVDWLWEDYFLSEWTKDDAIDVRFVTYDTSATDCWDHWNRPYMSPLFGRPYGVGVVRLSRTGIEMVSHSLEKDFLTFYQNNSSGFVSEQLATWADPEKFQLS